MRCSFVWCIFGIVDINNICVNLIKVSKVWLLKNLHALHYRVDGISLPPLSYLPHHSALSGLLDLSQTLLVSLVRDLALMPWWPVLPGVDVICKIFLPGQACVVLKRLVHAWARQSINVPSINPCINYLMLISIHVADSLVAAWPGTARHSKSVAWARLLAVSGVQPG